MAKSWLNDLEDKVRQTSEALRALRDENEELKTKVAELETRLENVHARRVGVVAPAGDEAWQRERQEIRERVEALVDHLSGLLSGG